MIVVTGGAGFIGSALVWELNRAGQNDILVVDQKAENSPKWKNLEHLRFRSYMESGEFLRQLEKKEIGSGFKAIFHMGACSDTTERDAAYLRENNSRYSERLAEWAVKNKVYFLYAASAAAYGAGELGYFDNDALTPDLEPLNPYGRSKLDFDVWVLKNGFEKKIVGLRFFNVYGPNEYHKGEMRSMVHKGFGQIQSSGALRLFKSYRPDYADGAQKRDFIYVKDVTAVMAWFYKHPGETGIYNLGTGQARTWNDLARALFKACGKPERIEYIEMPDSIKKQYQYLTEANLLKLRKTGCPTNFQTLEKGVTDYVRNYLTTPNPYLAV